MYNERRCILTYYGHRQAVRDINFNNSGKQFLSAGIVLLRKEIILNLFTYFSYSV